MMSQQSKKELLEVVRERYVAAKRKEKQRILDELVAATGYHRKYAIRVLKYSRGKGLIRKKGRKKVYQGDVVIALEQIWEVCGRICSRRLQPFLPEMVRILKRLGALTISAETEKLLFGMSRATIDRCLGTARKIRPHGLSTTKPGTLLKKAIPIHTYTPWDEEKPGFLEIDLVAHCGDTAEGQFVNTLTCVDVSTGWTECLTILPRTKQTVFSAIQGMRSQLPFALLGIDSDNGTEFINDLLYHYCDYQKITFTRSRPYHKNDQAHVEQKNWSVVRRWIGYDRLDTQAQALLLQEIYQDLRLYVNFFQPVLKLVAKQHVDNKLIKRYDTAATPYQRVLASANVPLEAKARLTNLYVRLNPVLLRTTIDRKVDQLWKLSR
ncbi:MAG TPA: ISNCY family transposase [Anaerolineales bacterium]|nr:ISNCY family transposase [Anaerolineales bacterium]